MLGSDFITTASFKCKALSALCLIFGSMVHLCISYNTAVDVMWIEATRSSSNCPGSTPPPFKGLHESVRKYDAAPLQLS